PSRQQIAILVGVVTSALCVGPVLAAVNRGATATVPEVHPGIQVTHPSTEVVRQREFPFRPAAGAFAPGKLTGPDRVQQLWRRGFEVRLGPDGAPVAIRTFRRDVAAPGLLAEEVRTGSEHETEAVPGRTTLGALGALGEPVDRELHAGFVRNDAPIP